MTSPNNQDSMQKNNTQVHILNLETIHAGSSDKGHLVQQLETEINEDHNSTKFLTETTVN